MNLKLQPLDRVAITLGLILSILIGFVLWGGDHTQPLVRQFNWADKVVGAENTAFLLDFNRAMQWDQVEPNLKISPNLDGKLSWSGRRLAYSLTETMPYGQAFEVELSNVQEASRGPRHQPKAMAPFNSTFRSRDRAFAYLGVNGEESGRLILYNLSQKQKTILTPENLVITNFQLYPLGDRILISAVPRSDKAQGNADSSLYSVSTGLAVNAPDQPEEPVAPAGTLTPILDDPNYQTFKFQLAPDGNQIIAQRLEKTQGIPAVVTLWQIPDGGKPKLLEGVDGGDFLIAPDSQTLVIAQGQGIGLLPLDEEDASQPLDFLPQFGTVLSFAADGTAATMIRFNKDFTRSLFLVTNQGVQEELIKTEGSVRWTAFDQNKEWLYCLLTEVQDSEEYIESPYLAKINLQSKVEERLVNLTPQLDVTVSLSPDNTSLIFDQIIDADRGRDDALRTEQGGTVTTSHLWELPLTADTPELIPVSQISEGQVASGLSPQWLP